MTKREAEQAVWCAAFAGFYVAEHAWRRSMIPTLGTTWDKPVNPFTAAENADKTVEAFRESQAHEKAKNRTPTKELWWLP